MTKEVTTVRNWWIRRVQERERTEPHFGKLEAELGLQPNKDNLLVCHGRIRGQYPIYLPRDAKFTEKLVQRVHGDTLHGGVSLTMAAVREQFWVRRLGSLVKLVRSRCYGCKRFRAIAMAKPAPGQLPEERTTVGRAFEVLGTDFAGLSQLRKDEQLQCLLEQHEIIWKFNLSRQNSYVQGSWWRIPHLDGIE